MKGMKTIQTKSGLLAVLRDYSTADRESVVELFRKAFSGPPYFENNPSEVIRDLFRTYEMEPDLFFHVVTPIQNGEGETVIGLSIAYRLDLSKFRCLEVPFEEMGISINSHNIAYGAELAVEPGERWRNQGIATIMMAERIRLVREAGFDYLIGRTRFDSFTNPIYARFGFIRIEGLADPDFPERRYFVKDLNSA